MIITKLSNSLSSIDYIEVSRAGYDPLVIPKSKIQNFDELDKLSNDFTKYKAFLEFNYWDPSMKDFLLTTNSSTLTQILKFIVSPIYNTAKLLIYGKKYSGKDFSESPVQPTERDYYANRGKYYIKSLTYLLLKKGSTYNPDLTYYRYSSGNYVVVPDMDQDKLDGDESYYIEAQTYVLASTYREEKSYYIWNGTDYTLLTLIDKNSPDWDRALWDGDATYELTSQSVYIIKDESPYEKTSEDLSKLINSWIPDVTNADAAKNKFSQNAPWKFNGAYTITFNGTEGDATTITNISEGIKNSSELNHNTQIVVYCDKYGAEINKPYYVNSANYMNCNELNLEFDPDETYYIDENIDLIMQIQFETSTDGADINRDSIITISLGSYNSNSISLSRITHEDSTLNEQGHLSQYYDMIPFIDSSDLLSKDYLEEINNLPNGVIVNNMLMTNSFEKYNLGYTYVPGTANTDFTVYVTDF